MSANSPKIISNQFGIHDKLTETVQKHMATIYRKPLAKFSIPAFIEAEKTWQACGKPLILDSGCGTGESTLRLARLYPSHFVLGIDKSAVRLQKAAGISASNLAFVRTDIFDFWRQAAAAGWRVERHYLLYPNPWPKKRDLKHRYHGHPAFPDLLRLGRYFEIRTNWEIYLQEFTTAVNLISGFLPQIERFEPVEFFSNFEKKFHRSGHVLYKSCFSFHNR